MQLGGEIKVLPLAVQKLTRAECHVSRLIEAGWQLLRFRTKLIDRSAPVRPHARLLRHETAEHRCSRRIAGRRRTVGIREQDAPVRKPVHVRSQGLRMPIETANPVVQVIHGDEEDIGLIRGRGRGWHQEGQGEEEGKCANHEEGNSIKPDTELIAGIPR